jgi:hypothetical protein
VSPKDIATVGRDGARTGTGAVASHLNERLAHSFCALSDGNTARLSRLAAGD